MFWQLMVFSTFRKRGKLVFLLLTLYFTLPGYTQSHFSFRQLSVKDGLSQSNGVSVAQDSTGNLWIGTLDGLNRYDGNEFTVYKKYFWAQYSDEGYSHIGKVYADRKGNLWIIPIEKVPEKYDRLTDSFIPMDSVQEVSCMYQDQNFNYWFGTYGNGLYYLDEKSNTLKQVFNNEYRPTHIHHLTQDQEGNIIASGQNSIFRIDAHTLDVEQIQPLSMEEPVYYSVSVVDDQNNLWLGTYKHGLLFKSYKDSVYQNVSLLKLAGDRVPSNFAVMDLKIDSKNRLWIGSYGKGLIMIDLNTKTSYHFMADKYDPNAIHYNDIDCIYEDYAGTLWFGTDGAGLSYYDEYVGKFNAFTDTNLPPGISTDAIMAITKDQTDALWMGTFGNGLTRYDPSDGSWKNYIPNDEDMHSVGSYRIQSLMVDEENELWAGTQFPGGLSILSDNGKFRRMNEHSSPALDVDAVWCIYRDSKNNKWLGTIDSGIILFDKNKGIVRQYTTSNSDIQSNNIRVINEGRDGILWLGTESEGICRFNPVTGEFKSYQSAPQNDNSLSGNSIKSFYYDLTRDVLWIGTYGDGMCALEVDSGNFHRFSTKDGLSNDVIYGILPDRAGNLWLSSNKGITRFRPGLSLNQKPEIVNYSDYEPVDTEFNTGAYYKDAKGVLYFGGMEGIYWIDPDRFSQNNTIPKTAITKLEVFGKQYPMVGNIELEHYQSTVSFSFSGFQFSMPHKTSYHYKLENHDPQWISSQSRNYVRYTNLKPGNYRFLVKAANYDGVWNTAPAVLGFTIKPPWYQTNTAWIIYALLLLLSIYLLYRYLRWHFSVQYQLTYNKKESERLKQMHDLKTKFYTNISHEIRTPLTLISGPVHRQLSRENITKDDREDLQLIQRNADRMLSLIDQLLELSKLESGIIRLNVREGNLSSLFKSVASSFDFRARQLGITFHAHIPEDLQAWFDADIIEKLLYNLLSNAVKYTPKNGVMSFFARIEGSFLELIFTNTTLIPFSPKDLDNIFERFYQQNHHTDGVGVGLSLVREMVELSHGEIKVKMTGKNEIEFRVTLPAEPAYYKPEEIDSRESKKEIDTDFSMDQSNTPERPVLLVIDDNDDIRQFIRSIVKYGFALIEAENGEEGIQKAIENIPDIIISDIMMPIKSGIEVCNTLKFDERTSHIPILMLTAKAGEEHEIAGLRTGADDYMVKPFNSEKLLLKIRNLAESRRLLRQKYSREVGWQWEKIAITSTDEKFLTRLHHVLDGHMTDPTLNSDSLSRQVGMSRMQLHRKLTALTGLSTSAFLKSERCKLALNMLKGSDITVSEAAYATGFNSPSYFIKSFKEIYNMAPLEYIRENGN